MYAAATSAVARAMISSSATPTQGLTNGFLSSSAPAAAAGPSPARGACAAKRSLDFRSQPEPGAKHPRTEASHQIAALGPYTNKYKVRARVSQAGDIKKISTSRFQVTIAAGLLIFQIMHS